MKLLRFLLPVLLLPVFLTALHAQSNTTATVLRPYITSVSPSIISPGSPQTTITINGRRFQQGLEVYFSTQKLSQVFLAGDSLITATIPASLLIQPGQASLLVVNPDQTAIGFIVPIGVLRNETSRISIEPSVTLATLTAFTVRISGSGFNGNTRVFLDGFGNTELRIISISPTLILAQVPAYLNVPDFHVIVIVENNINVQGARLTIFEIERPWIQITRITPSILSATGGTITISGFGFSLGARVFFGSQQLTILSSSATQIAAVVPANLPFGYYLLSVVNPNGATATQALGYGVNSVFAPSENTTLYPNPATTALTLETTLDRAATLTLTLRNILGEAVLQERHTAASGRFSTTLDVSALANGVYMLEVSDGTGGRWVQKVVKY
ncbi:MAG: IPT/TIG domain-containing protein [Ignavibacteria bacterium]|nr:IPT/TIG domain-containing protein [Ignavibacteria bacterium]